MPARRIAKQRRTGREGEGETATIDITANSSDNISGINNLLPAAAENNPVLLTTLQGIVDELKNLGVAVYDPPVFIADIGGDNNSGKPLIPLAFWYELNPLNVVLRWSPANATYVFYEIRKGTSWDFATKELTTNNASAILEPLVYGTHTYLLKTLAVDGSYSNDTLRVDITIPVIGAFSILPLVASNAVTLSWTIPVSTFKIEFYEVRKNGVLVATTAGTFFAISEELGGTHTYGITPVDVAGNRGIEGTVSVVTTGITDYIFFDKKISTLQGTIVNGKRITGIGIYYCINTTETYQGHFTSRGWVSPQAQVNAGFAPWSSPYQTTGSYEETFDFGVLIHAVIVSVNWNYQVIYGSFAFGFQIQTSPDGTNWSAIQPTPSFFATEVRYVKIKLNFTPQDNKSLLVLRELTVALNVKRENDGGFGTALASDPLGTVVRFNKAAPAVPVFVDIESITVTPISNTATFTTYEFVDTPFPETFTVKIYDNSGVRITRDFRWAARGIV